MALKGMDSIELEENISDRCNRSGACKEFNYR